MSTLARGDRLSLPGRLRETSIELRAGEIACLIGPNGSGKTSLLHALAGVGEPSGEVEIDGLAPARVARQRRPRLLSFMPASRDVRWPLGARDLVALGGASADEIRTAMAQLELEELADRRVDRLSTGERSRVLLARALAARPKLLLLDEPLANLDPYWQLRLIALLGAEVRGSDRAALVAVHDLDSAARMADRLIVMSGGRIAADGAPEDILGSPILAEIFGIERVGEGWRLVTPPERPRSSP